MKGSHEHSIPGGAYRRRRGKARYSPEHGGRITNFAEVEKAARSRTWKNLAYEYVNLSEGLAFGGPGELPGSCLAQKSVNFGDLRLAAERPLQC